MSLSTHLRKLGTGKIMPQNNTVGICYEVGAEFGQGARRKVKRLMEKWPKYSGDFTYPIPHKNLSPGNAFNYTEDLWGNSEYGNLRRELCIWLADRLEEV